MINNFFAILEDLSVRRITLLQAITSSIRSVFIEFGSEYLNGKLERVEFDGNYYIEDDQVLYVTPELPENIKEVETNSIGISILDLKKDKIKTLFWYEDGKYYFQNFDSRKLLMNRNVLYYDKRTYTKLKENAFIVDNSVAAVFDNKQFLFFSFTNANKILNLSTFYQQATDEEIKEFAKDKNVVIDEDWFIENSNTIIRKQITLLLKSNTLANADTRKIKSNAKKFKLDFELDKKDKIVFPKDKKACRAILEFLNEQYYFGVITGNRYKAKIRGNA